MRPVPGGLLPREASRCVVFCMERAFRGRERERELERELSLSFRSLNQTLTSPFSTHSLSFSPGPCPAASGPPRSRQEQEEEQVQGAAQSRTAVPRGQEAREGGHCGGRAAAARPQRPEQHADPQLQQVGRGQTHAAGRQAGSYEEDVRGWRRRGRRGGGRRGRRDRLSSRFL